MESGSRIEIVRRDPIESIELAEALGRQCWGLGFRSGVAVSATFRTLSCGLCLPAGARTSIVRIVHEALTNIARHAHAKQVSLRLEIDTARKVLFLEIQDDGCGFDPQSSSAGTGVRKMMSYADDLDAEMEITSKSNVGTVVRLWLPLVDPVEVLVIDRMKRPSEH